MGIGMRALMCMGFVGAGLVIFADVISGWLERRLKPPPRRPLRTYEDRDSLYRLRIEVAVAEALLSAQDTGKVLYVHDPATGELEHIRVLMKDWDTGEVEFQHFH